MFKAKLTTLDLIRVYLRSFFVQASWNFQRMLNLGMTFSLLPILRKLTSDRGQQIAFLKRHLRFFNANPFISTFGLGAIARIEEEHVVGSRDISDEQIGRMQEILSGPLGSVGDQLFWKTFRPMAAAWGVASVLILGIWGVVVFLLVFNVPHLGLRWYGLTRGYKMGTDIVREFARPMYKRCAVWGERGMAMGAGLVLGINLMDSSRLHVLLPALTVLLFIGSRLLLKRGWSPTPLFLGIVIGGMVLSWLGLGR